MLKKMKVKKSEKGETMVFIKENSFYRLKIKLNGDEMEQVESYKNLGWILSADVEARGEMKQWL